MADIEQSLCSCGRLLSPFCSFDRLFLLPLRLWPPGFLFCRSDFVKQFFWTVLSGVFWVTLLFSFISLFRQGFPSVAASFWSEGVFSVSLSCVTKIFFPVLARLRAVFAGVRLCVSFSCRPCFLSAFLSFVKVFPLAPWYSREFYSLYDIFICVFRSDFPGLLLFFKSDSSYSLPFF